MKETLTANQARELLTYDPDTGSFFWAATRNNRTRKGQEAGSLSDEGYVCVKVGGRSYKAHRLAWLMSYGEWPAEQIDHIDHCRSNNRLENLRQVTHVDNHRNKSLRVVNTSGVTGVHWSKGYWIARIGVFGKRVHLGQFRSLDAAAAARKEAEAANGFHANHGVNVHHANHAA